MIKSIQDGQQQFLQVTCRNCKGKGIVQLPYLVHDRHAGQSCTVCNGFGVVLYPERLTTPARAEPGEG